MAEYIRDIEVRLTVDTNKRTLSVVRNVDSLDEIREIMEELIESCTPN